MGNQTQSVVVALAAAGYTIENMGAVWGEKFEGQYRWIQAGTGRFQDHEPSYSEASAVAEAVADMEAQAVAA